MAFNADEHVAALLPPVLIAGGKKYVGRILSVEEVGRIYAEATAGDGMKRGFTRACVKAWFPSPWYARLVGYNRVWRVFKRLPDAVQVDALESFFLVQRMAAPVATRRPLNEANAPSEA